MYRSLIGLFILPASLFCGCGASSSQSPTASPHHGGYLVPLPESEGFVEVKADRGLPAKGSRKGPNKSRIATYFYQPDGTTALSPAPTDVKVTLGAVGTGTVINLAPQAGETGAFASEPGDYPDGLRGQVDFQLAGKPVTVTFSFR